MQRHCNFLEQEYGSIIASIKTLVVHESPTSSKEHCDQTVMQLKYLFEQNLDCCTEIIPQQQFGNFLRVDWGHGSRQILLVGHYDTVHPVGTLQENPFSIKDGKIFGPGIYDMKCGIVQALFALKSLESTYHVTQELKVVCFFNSDEEVGSPKSQAQLLALAAESKFAFVMEPSAGKTGALKTGRKGVGTYKAEAFGKSAHAGNCPEEGASAITEICRQALRFQSLSDPVRGIYVSCGLISGGTAKNTIPEYSQAVFDLRVDTLDAMRTFERALQTFSAFDPAVKFQLSGTFTRPPMEKSTGQQNVFGLAEQLLWENRQQKLTQISVGGASDGNILAQKTDVLDGMGAVGAGAHTLQEFVYASHIIPRTALLAALLERI